MMIIHKKQFDYVRPYLFDVAKHLEIPLYLAKLYKHIGFISEQEFNEYVGMTIIN